MLDQLEWIQFYYNKFNFNLFISSGEEYRTVCMLDRA